MISEISQFKVGMTDPQSAKPYDRVDPLQRVDAVTSVAATAVEDVQDTEQQDAEAVVDGSQLKGMVQDLNEFAQVVQRKLQFNIDEESGKTVIKVVDAQTDEVIREVPPEAILEMQKRLAEVNGVLFNSEA